MAKGRDGAGGTEAKEEPSPRPDVAVHRVRSLAFCHHPGMDPYAFIVTEDEQRHKLILTAGHCALFMAEMSEYIAQHYRKKAKEVPIS